MEQRFRQLVDEFCAITELDDADAIVEGMSFEVDAVECALIYRNQIAPEVVYCYIDFGLPPGDRLQEIHAQLLEMNYLEFAGGNSAFALSPHTGHVVFVTMVPIAQASGLSLADKFAYHAQQALQWREQLSIQQKGVAEAITRIPFA